MKRFPKILRVLVPLVLVLGLGLVLINTFLIDFVVKALWYDSLGYLPFMLLKLGYKYIVFTGVTIVFFLMLFLNFWIASRYLGVTKFHKESKFKKVVEGFRSGSLKVYTPLAFILAIPLALPIFREWENFLLYFNAPQTGSADALFRLDVSFYLFALPLLKLIHGRILLTLVFLLIALVVLYAAELKMLSKEGQPLYRGAKFHLSLVVFSILLVHAAEYGLEVLMLQYTTNNAELFYGPGYTEVFWQMPLIGLAAFMMLPLAISIILWIYRQRGLKTVILFVILSLVAHGVRNSKALFNSVNIMHVVPNELGVQGPYIKQSIDATLDAYQLTRVKRRPFELQEAGASFSLAGGLNELDNIPLWDSELLESVYQQMQALRPYYRFSGVDAARYMINESLQQVYLAAREINTDGIAAQAKNWVNQRLKYTHGYGMVMTPAAQSGEERMRWFIQNMPPESQMGYDVNHLGIYYGMEDLDYVIAPNENGEFHYPGGEGNGAVTSKYDGKGGVAISGFLKKTLFAIYFKDRNLFFTTQTTKDSRIHFIRNIVDRIEELTPFFQLDDNPYLAVTPDRMYWIVDAYTTSKWYPNSQPFNNDLNYIRNSIKIVVDAYEGTVKYYLADPTDPIGRAYQKMYPNLIEDLSEMPDDLRSQIRYPRNLFEIQMRMYAIYHQEDPEIYYLSEDRLQFAEFTHQDSLIEMRPYYITLDLIEPGKREFLLLTPLLPYIDKEAELAGVKNSEDTKPRNLRALGVVRSDGDHYGEIIFYTFPKGSTIIGPPQVNALIDQNTDIAQSITLWNQQGSEVKRGKMIILPIDGRIIYIQPFYMEATGSLSIPQLKRVIVCVDEEVVMDVSIEKAMRRIHDKLSDDSVPFMETFQEDIDEVLIEPILDPVTEDVSPE
ncbi:UPF0182 family protein [Kiritimatiellaeota bacterium B1221]|nr:UPF0182 family protein [Kiritimatiellaeota bacterium B1221]